MRSSDSNPQLTAAARRSLHELVRDYRRELALAVNDIAVDATGRQRPATVSDVLQAYARIRPAPGRQQLVDLFDRTFKIYLVFGLLAAGLGLAAWMLRFAGAAKDLYDKAPPLLIAGGILMASIALVWLLQRQITRTGAGAYSERGESIGAGQRRAVLILWQELELAIRNRVATLSGESVAAEPISALVATLERDAAISLSDAVQLKQFLALRNSLAHRLRDDPIAPSELRQAVENGDRLLAKLGSAESTSRTSF